MAMSVNPIHGTFPSGAPRLTEEAGRILLDLLRDVQQVPQQEEIDDAA